MYLNGKSFFSQQEASADLYINVLVFPAKLKRWVKFPNFLGRYFRLFQINWRS